MPHEDVKKKIASLAVGLASDCDRPESDVQKIMREHLANARTLPFVAFVTHDGKWVTGYSGHKNSQTFLNVLETAENTPHLQASKAVRKKLAGLVATATKAVERGDWKSVVKASLAAAKTTGRCPERDEMAALFAKAQAWAKQQFDAAIRLARTGGDLAEARKAVGEVKKHFLGAPELADAATGLKALKRLDRIRGLEAKPNPPPAGLREKEALKFKDTRWASIFQKAEPGEEEK